jgi:hypothetical protein
VTRRIGSPDQRIESRIMGSLDATRRNWSSDRQIECRIMGSLDAR